MTPDDPRPPLPSPGSLLLRQVSPAPEPWTPSAPSAPANAPSAPVPPATAARGGAALPSFDDDDIPSLHDTIPLPDDDLPTLVAPLEGEDQPPLVAAEAAAPGVAPPKPQAPTPPAGAAARPSGAGDPPSDLAIPMLTEVVDLPRYAGVDLPERLADVDWTALENRVREHVLDRMLRRSDLLVETRVREALATSLARTTAALAAELQSSLTEIVREMVSRAVGEERTRVHETMARRDGWPAADPPPTPRSR